MTLDAAFLHALEAAAPTRLGEPLSRHTTIGIGGPADAYVTPETTPQVVDVLRLCAEASVPVFMLGSGSNIVVGDLGIRGVVLDNHAQQLSNLGQLDSPSPPAGRGPEEGVTLFRGDSGCSFAGIARQLAFSGHAGLEWACGIPGTIGGAVVYNAGAYGGCLADVLLRAGLWDPERGEHIIEASDLGLVYRGSAFTRGLMHGRAVLWSEFALWPGDPKDLRARVADYDARRLKAQPRGRNAGSFFKNPPGQPAWKLLDGAGLRGYRIGGAQFSEVHCNFLINAGGASAADVADLMREAQTRVRGRFGIDLENEVSLVGEGFGAA